ncbi:MAG: FtsX-like permease family protein [Solirubrobacteraceae bacterium]
MNANSLRSIFGIRVSMLAHLYRRRLRLHTAQELLAGAGIAVGVGLVFGVLLANASLLGAAEDTVHGVIGSARLELAARSNAGFDQGLADRVRRLPGVQSAAAVLQESATVVGPRARVHVQMVGVTPTLVTLGGSIPQRIGAGPSLVGEGVALPSIIAGAVGARPEQTVEVLAGGFAHRARVSAVAGAGTLGAAGESPILVALIGEAQRLTGREGRVTQVFVRPSPGKDGLVESELRVLARGRLNVTRADDELALLRQIAKPSGQATVMFALIGGMVGFLFTFNAMLLTVPERRRYVADLRMQGYDWRQVLVILGFDALALGIGASIVGVLLGYLASRAVFHTVPVYLAFAFPIGHQQTVKASLVVLAVGCGTLATLLASLLPVADLRANRARDALLRSADDTAAATVSNALAVWLGMFGLLLIVVSTVVSVRWPRFSLVGGVVLAFAAVLVMPVLFATVARALRWLSERVRSSALVLTARELRTAGLPVIALAAVGALALYGSVAVAGARRDLIAGLDTNFSEYLGTADLWITTGGNDLTTNSFHAGVLPATISRLPQVSAVRAYRGQLLDVGDRRMWIVGRPAADRVLVPPGQLLSGRLAVANARLREGGWAAISTGFAGESHLRVGDAFVLPSPSGARRLRVAAIITNAGWPPGAIILNSRDYARFWGSADPSALEVTLRPGASAATARLAVQSVLDSHPGIAVQTRRERESLYKANSRESVSTLSEISILLLIAAALAVASALTATIWRRRPQLASLKVQGYDRNQLWRALLLESAVVLGVGCTVGAILGVLGHSLATRWLVLSTGFQAPFSPGVSQLLLDFALVAGVSLIVIALPGLLAARVSARLALQE